MPGPHRQATQRTTFVPAMRDTQVGAAIVGRATSVRKSGPRTEEIGMRSIAWIAFGGALLLASGAARADVVGSFEGTLAGKSGSVAMSAVFKQTGRVVSGTVALPGDLAPY